MGGGKWSDDSYKSLKVNRLAAGIDDFDYSRQAKENRNMAIAENLDPKRINKKPFGKLESRDSQEHPESNPVFIGFDVTGSNSTRAVEAQKRLPKLMKLLEKYLSDPQVLVAANDDYKVEPERCVQISDFESDIRIDSHIRSIILVDNGGGNSGESYDLLLYAAARKTVLDSVEKRNKKGYLFLYADEPFMEKVSKKEVNAVFGDTLEGDIPIKQMVKEARELYNVYIIWPRGGYLDAREQYIKLFGKEFVLDLQDPSMICELVGSVIGINEEKIIDVDSLEKDLREVSTDANEINSVITAVKRKFRKPEIEATA